MMRFGIMVYQVTYRKQSINTWVKPDLIQSRLQGTKAAVDVPDREVAANGVCLKHGECR